MLAGMPDLGRGGKVVAGGADTLAGGTDLFGGGRGHGVAGTGAGGDGGDGATGDGGRGEKRNKDAVSSGGRRGRTGKHEAEAVWRGAAADAQRAGTKSLLRPGASAGVRPGIAGRRSLQGQKWPGRNRGL